jgi:hypothetical protein
MTANATIHSTGCGQYVVSINRGDRGHHSFACYSLQQAYEALRKEGVASAQLTQRVAYDEMVGQASAEGVSVISLAVPPR